MFRRLFSKTPPFFKIIRNISIMVTALSVTTLLQENEKEIIDLIKKEFSFESVSNSFFNSANEFLKEIDNYK